MVSKKIQITGVIASARRFSRVSFSIVNDDGTTTDVVYPQARNGEDADSLQVENSIFSTAQAIYFSTTTAADRTAQAELYVNNQCCCCTKVHVEGILSLTPVST